jgi:hypothetical protein
VTESSITSRDRRRLTIAALDVPVRQQANWLNNVNVGGCGKKAIHRNRCIMIRPMTQVKIGTMQIGRKSATQHNVKVRKCFGMGSFVMVMH